MNDEERRTHNPLEPSPSLAAWCSECKQHVDGKEHGWFEEEDDYGNGVTRYTLLECPRCSSALLARHLARYTYHQADYQQGGPWSATRTLYPGEPAQPFGASVPRAIITSYQEAHDVFHKARSNTAAAIMCRRTLEGICAHFGTKSRDKLPNKLQKLKTEGVIDEKMFNWADQVLRELGNDAAHDVGQTISREDAQAALDFTRALIEQLFVIQPALDRFLERRKNKPDPK